MPPKKQPVQPVEILANKKRKSPDEEKCAQKEGLSTKVGLWSEDHVEVLDKEAKVKMEKEGRKRVRRARKRAKASLAVDELEEKSSGAEVIMALDMSTSPGLAIIDRSSGTARYELMGFSQTDKQQSKFNSVANERKTPGYIGAVFDKSHHVNVHVLRAPKEGKYLNNTEYYEIITSKMMELIKMFQTKKCLVIVEAYAYHILHSSSITSLAELGGVMRNKLFLSNIPFLEVSPTSIKKWFTGSGAADKPQMWKQFVKIAPLIKLQEWLPAPFSDTKIPSPHQDIVDAFASAHSVHKNSFKAFIEARQNIVSSVSSEDSSDEDDDAPKPVKKTKR